MSYNRNTSDETVKFSHVYELNKGPQLELIKFLQERGLLSESYKCPKCGGAMRISPRADVSDGFNWICYNEHLKTARTLRKGTWFEKSNLKMGEILMLTYYWLHEYPQQIVMFELGTSSKTVVDWYNFCREICVEILLNTRKIGGPGHIVEIGESKFSKRKYNHGKSVTGQWVFGGVDRETGQCFLQAVEDRTAGTLLAVIKDRVLPGTAVYSDCWKSYNCLQHEGFEHLTVNHSITFKDKETGCHTNMIQGMWKHVKSKMPPTNRNTPMFGSYLSEFMYRRMHAGTGRGALFSTYVKDVAAVYTPSDED